MTAGEEKIWETLSSLDPADVCRRTGVDFDGAAGLYKLRSFGKDFIVSPEERLIAGDFPGSEIFLRRLGYFFRSSISGYMALSRDVALTGRLVKPSGMKSGQLFFRGSHTLPVEKVADKYGEDREGFLRAGLDLGGERLGYGDISFRLLPLPRVPAVMILWCPDEEFPARADILFDSSCELQLPVDIIWAVAMLCVFSVL